MDARLAWGTVQVTVRVLVMGLLGACMFLIAGLVLAANPDLAAGLRILWLVLAVLGAVAIVFYLRRLLAIRRR